MRAGRHLRPRGNRRETGAAVISYYTNDPDATDKTFTVTLDRAGDYEICAIDEDHDGDKIGAFSGTAIEITMKPNTLIKIGGKIK
ncbi:MAG: hypothetical protein IKK74_09925 [Clostridia bacterium]|nr:hypothetical protein [Clostridia bacterium]